MQAIVAVTEHWGIGRDGDQLIYLPSDLKHFKQLTMGRPVILGRRTLATFPGGRPLKGRRNLILSRDPAFRPEGAEVYPDVDALLNELDVLVDDKCAVENVTRFAEGQGYTVTWKAQDDEFAISLRK